MNIPTPSIWQRTTTLATADVLIIGGGIVGVSTAISLRSNFPGLRVVVLDRSPWGDGASYRNAGFACLGSPSELLADLESRHADEVWSTVEMRWRGLRQLRQWIPDGRMQLNWCGGTELFPDTEDIRFAACQAALPTLNARMKEVTGHPHHFRLEESPEHGWSQLAGSIRIADEGRLHPGLMMQALRSLATGLGVTVWGGCLVKQVDANEQYVAVEMSTGEVLRSDCVALATNGFTPHLDTRPAVQPARNQVYLSPPLRSWNWDTCIHMHQGYIYARRLHNRLLIGGGRQIALDRESTDEPGLTADIRRYLEGIANTHFGLSDKVHLQDGWSGILGVGEAKHPEVCEIERDIYAAVRLGGMGVAIGTQVGIQLAELIGRRWT